MTDSDMMSLVQLEATPLIPVIPLYVADHIVHLWQRLKCTAPPYWAFAWTGGQALARYTLDNPGIFQGKTVLDVGCGTGLNAIAAKLAGASHVVAADNIPESRELTQINADLHVVSIDIRDTVPPARDFDIVLFGDTFYDFELYQFVMELTDDALRFGRTVLAGDPRREFLPMRRCVRLADYTVPDTMMLERRPRTPAWAFQLIGNA